MVQATCTLFLWPFVPYYFFITTILFPPLISSFPLLFLGSDSYSIVNLFVWRELVAHVTSCLPSQILQVMVVLTFSLRGKDSQCMGQCKMRKYYKNQSLALWKCNILTCTRHSQPLNSLLNSTLQSVCSPLSQAARLFLYYFFDKFDSLVQTKMDQLN